MPAVKVLIRHSGPLPDGEARGIIKRAMSETKRAMGEELVRQVQLRLDSVLVNPTGYYRSQVDYGINQGNGAVIVHDRGVIYGPWLEGDSRRNAETRFKGYHTFRHVTQTVQGDVDRVGATQTRVMVSQLS